MGQIRRQSTLSGPAVTAGIELHGGEHTRLVMRPAPMGTGLVFMRTDVTDRDNRIEVRQRQVLIISLLIWTAKNCQLWMEVQSHF